VIEACCTAAAADGAGEADNAVAAAPRFELCDALRVFDACCAEVAESDPFLDLL
jgi:hypothetical protein